MSETDLAFVGSVPELYDRYMGPMLFEPYALDMGRRLHGFEGALLETAAGTGRVTRAIAAAVGPGATIVATDLNEPMLQVAAEAVGAANVSWRQADALALPFADASFDAVVCQFGVMFFPDKIAGFAEARRVLKPAGRFVFSVWGELEANEFSWVVHNALAAMFPDDPPSFYARTPFGYHDEQLIRSQLADVGFAGVDVECVDVETRAASAAEAATGLCLGTPLRAELETRAPGMTGRVVEAVAEALARDFGTGEITGRGRALVVSART
jgi:SAM-dependent methyltransferase